MNEHKMVFLRTCTGLNPPLTNNLRAVWEYGKSAMAPNSRATFIFPLAFHPALYLNQTWNNYLKNIFIAKNLNGRLKKKNVD